MFTYFKTVYPNLKYARTDKYIAVLEVYILPVPK